MLVPTTFRSAEWEPGETPDTCSATWRIDDRTETVHLTVGPDGRLVRATIDRWGNPDGEPHGRYPFGVTVEAETTSQGVTIPSVLRAGWWAGTSREAHGEFFRATITDMAFV